jgi:N-acetylglucosamine kinase-like BadF-type ATPase
MSEYPVDHLVGIDVGGTKTHLASIDASGERHDVVRPSSEWRTGHLFADDQNLVRLAAWIATHTRLDATTGVAIGLRDCDTDADLELARDTVSRVLGLRVRVENDADLLAPAVGTEHAIAMVVGTGSIVSARDAGGRRITADGHGWLFGDWGSGPGMVRDAIIRTLVAMDGGATAEDDALVAELLRHYGANDAAGLAASATIEASPDGWGSAAARVFEADRAGSPLARKTIAFAAERLVDGVAAVVRRGGLGDRVVAAGGVVVNQPTLRRELRMRLAGLERPLELKLLDVEPVEGALRLAATSRQPASA